MKNIRDDGRASAQDKERINDDPSLTIGLKTSQPRVLMQATLKRMQWCCFG